MQCDVLDAHEVFAWWRGFGEGEGDCVFAPGAPVCVFQAVGDVGAETHLEDFEPGAGAIVGFNIARCFGKVDLEGSGVLPGGKGVVSRASKQTNMQCSARIFPRITGITYMEAPNPRPNPSSSPGLTVYTLVLLAESSEPMLQRKSLMSRLPVDTRLGW